MTSNDGSKSEAECCMCGDFGFSYELFLCKICQFRSQHRYCSNLYPKADCYQICNWCLFQKEESSNPKSPNSSSSASFIKPQISTHQIPTFQSQLNKPIKKQSSPQLILPPPPTRQRNLPLDDKLQRTRSEEISHRIGIKRPIVFRNKVRRYKLLDEVSS